jgi:hypothetical protein
MIKTSFVQIVAGGAANAPRISNGSFFTINKPIKLLTISFSMFVYDSTMLGIAGDSVLKLTMAGTATDVTDVQGDAICNNTGDVNKLIALYFDDNKEHVVNFDFSPQIQAGQLYLEASKNFYALSPNAPQMYCHVKLVYDDYK